MTGALPTMVVVGAMKCGTSALHAYLDAHPDIAMAATKEANFFFGSGQPPAGPENTWWREGQWHRGAGWYADQFDEACRVRGESSPGYTDPSHPEVPARMAVLLPAVRLVYLVRDPVDRAVSQYRHHARDGSERRPIEEALLDPESQYLARSRHHERIEPFLEHFAREQLLVVVQERMLADRRGQLSRVFRHVGADPDFWDPAHLARVHVGEGADQELPAGLRREFWGRVRDDVDRLRELVGEELEEWQDPGERVVGARRVAGGRA
ncbi:MAG: sulfotransferase family protein [Marmoricola sp.]